MGIEEGWLVHSAAWSLSMCVRVCLLLLCCFLTAARQDLGKFVVFKVGVMFTTLFLFFTTTTLVSFTLRETQV